MIYCTEWNSSSVHLLKYGCLHKKQGKYFFSRNYGGNGLFSRVSWIVITNTKNITFLNIFGDFAYWATNLTIHDSFDLFFFHFLFCCTIVDRCWPFQLVKNVTRVSRRTLKNSFPWLLSRESDWGLFLLYRAYIPNWSSCTHTHTINKSEHSRK